MKVRCNTCSGSGYIQEKIGCVAHGVKEAHAFCDECNLNTCKLYH